MSARLWRRPWIQVCAVGLASGVVTALVVLQLRPGSDPGPDVPSLESLSAKGAPPAAVKASLARRFRVFRGPARPADRLLVADSRSARGDVDAGYVRETGMDVSLARRLRSAPRVFAVPARGAVCLIYERAGGECTPAASAHRSFQVRTCGHLASGRFELSGLVADSTERATLRLRDESRVRLPIVRNFVDLVRPARRPSELPAWVELQAGGRVRRAKVPVLTMRSLACERRGASLPGP